MTVALTSMTFAAVLYPDINPIALSLGKLQIHWYGLAYLCAFLTAYALAYYRSKKRNDFTPELVSDLVFYGALGVILGGRIGYVLLYQFGEFIHNPLFLFKIWQGGMSFHGGFIGVMLAMCYFAWRYKKTPFQVLDFIAPCVPTGLLFGRIGNFINGELWGRVSEANISWLMYFKTAVQEDYELLQINPKLQAIATPIRMQADTLWLLPRHPSQLYEALSEGLILFALLWWFSAKPRPRMAVSALFLLGYGISRFTIEFYRQPDAGYALIFGWMSKGQLYTLPMLIFGVALFILAYRRKIYDWQPISKQQATSSTNKS